MEEEDDMVVVIVEDDTEKLNIKQDPGDQEMEVETLEAEFLDDSAVEEVIAAAKKHGMEVPFIKTEKTESDENDLHFKSEDPDYLPIEDELDEEELFDDEFQDLEVVNYNGDATRRKMLKPLEQRSFVKKLLEDHPDLEDEDVLVWTLVQIMWNTKKPEPPEGCYTVDIDGFQCSVCLAQLKTKTEASRHYQEKHGPRYLFCFACGVDFRSTTNLYKHEKHCSAPDIKVVLKARALSLGKKGRSRPFLPKKEEMIMIKKNKQLTQFICKECPAMFTTKSTLQAHEYHHRGERPYRCTQCVAAYTSPSGLSRHMKQHSDVRYICDHCGRSFKVKAALIAHLDTHLPQRKYSCGECGRRFAQKMAARLHADTTHRGLPPPCACQICPKRYPRMSLLKNHMKKEHGMILMTRKMFFQKLPTMTKSQVEKARLVMKSDVSLFEDSDLDFLSEPVEEQQVSTQESVPNQLIQYSYENGELVEQDCKEDSNELSEEVMNYIQLVQDGSDNTHMKILVVQHGELLKNANGEAQILEISDDIDLSEIVAHMTEQNYIVQQTETS